MPLAPEEVEAGEPVCCPVPDFIQWDSSLVGPSAPAAEKDRRGRRKRAPALTPAWKRDVARLLVIGQRSNVIVVPDLLLAQLVWGARSPGRPWPANWRRPLAAA